MDFFEEVILPSIKEDADASVLRTGFDDYMAKKGEEVSLGIRQNRDTILEEKREVSKQFKEIQDKYSFLDGKEFDGKEFGAEVFNKMNSDLESYKSSTNKDAEEFRNQLVEQYNAGKNAQLETVTPTINSLKLQLEESNTARDKYHGQYKNYLKDSALRRSLSKTGIEADQFWIDGFTNSAKVEYDEMDEIKAISVKHDGGYIPIEDWERIAPTTDWGKKMIKAPVSTGFGGKGSGSGTGGAVTLDDINKMEDPVARRAELVKYLEKQK